MARSQKMSTVVQIFTLLLYSVSLQHVGASNAGSSSTNKKTDFENNNRVNKNFQECHRIFRTYGIPINSKETVYSVIEKGKSITYGHAVCKHVLTKMGKTSDLKSVEITYDALIPMDYSYGNEKFNNYFLKLFGAKCYYGDRPTDFLFVTDSKHKDYYYVFDTDDELMRKFAFTDPDHKLRLKIEDCFKIVINKETDFPKINGVEETQDSLIAETIFGDFGYLNAYDRSHVCCNTSPSNRANFMCDRFRKKHQQIYEIPAGSPKCAHYKITRRKIKGFSKSKRPVSTELPAAECQFTWKNGKFIKKILLFNANKLDHYFVAEYVPGPEPIWLIKSILKLDRK